MFLGEGNGETGTEIRGNREEEQGEWSRQWQERAKGRKEKQKERKKKPTALAALGTHLLAIPPSSKSREEQSATLIWNWTRRHVHTKTYTQPHTPN